MSDEPGPPDTGAPDGAGPVAEVRPPRPPLKVMAAIAAITVPLALVAATQGDAGLGVVALLSAGWAGSVAYVGWTAGAVADAEGVTVHWLRRTQSVPWSEVTGVVVDRSGPGGTRRGARFLLTGDRSLPWTPWVALLLVRPHVGQPERRRPRAGGRAGRPGSDHRPRRPVGAPTENAFHPRVGSPP